MGLSLDLVFGGRGFESTSWFLRDMGLSLDLVFGDVGLSQHLDFWGL